MKSKKENISLSQNSTIDMKALQFEPQIFEKEDNHSYGICFLGSNSNAIFNPHPNDRLAANHPHIKEEVEELIQKIFYSFLDEKQEDIKHLRIITTGAAEGFPALVALTFKNLREDHCQELKEQKKELLLLAFTVEAKEELPVNSLNDSLMVAQSVTTQNQCMFNLSYLFIGLPGGKDTSSQLSTAYRLITTSPKNQDNLQILLHPFWEKDFSPRSEETGNISFLTPQTTFTFSKVNLKERKPTIAEDATITSLRKTIFKILYEKKEEEAPQNPLLAIDFNYYTETSKEKKYETHSFITSSYQEVYNEFLKEHNHLVFPQESDNLYGTTVLPNGFLQPQESLEETQESTNYQYDKNKKAGSFANLAKFLNQKQYGQFLMWRYIQTDLEGEKKAFSIVLLFNVPIPLVKENTIKRHLEDFIITFSNEKNQETLKGKNKQLEKISKSLEKQAQKSAYSQVSTRNMAHNIISHVLVNLHKTDAIAHLYQIINQPQAYQGRALSQIELSDQHQLATLFKYISNRCLYLNEATYGTSSIQGVRKVYTELFRELDENRILLNRISGISNFSYSLEWYYNNTPLTDTSDLLLMFPGDTLGQQAFYNILENIIRNTAKHNTNYHQHVSFTIHFTDPQSTLPASAHPEKYYQVSISDSIKQKEINPLIKDISKKINGKVINEKQQLRSHSLGILEMKASAAFLRQIDITNIDDPHPLPLLTAANVNGTLGYQFYIQKPEKYLIIISDTETFPLPNAQQQGIELLSPAQFKKQNTVYNADFILLYGEKSKEEVEKLTGWTSQFYPSHSQKIKSKCHRIPECSLWPERLMWVDEPLKERLNACTTLHHFETLVWEQWENPITNPDESQNQIVIFDNTLEHILSNALLQSAEYYLEICKKYKNCKQVVFFDHHCTEELWAKLPEFFKRGNSTFEALSSIAARKLPNATSEPIKYREIANQPVTCQKIVEAYFTKVIVIDERIQKFAETPYPQPNPPVYYKDYFKYTNLFIPEASSIDLANANISQSVPAIEEYIAQHLHESEFLIIHYGLLERMYGKENTNQTINNKLEQWAKQIRVVVTTGRGKHSLENLPCSVTYLNLSALLYAFKDIANKYLINYILNQTRR